jgi:uncharacterized protein YjdB
MKKLFYATIALIALSTTFTACKEKETPISVEGITLSETNTTLAVGDTLILTASVLPENATNKIVTWTSSNTSVATIDNDGMVIAKTEGTATITVSTQDGLKRATCTLAVVVPVTSVTLSTTDTTLLVGRAITLSATILPNNATNKTITWTSSDTTIATVTNGVVRGVAILGGKVTITATAQNGKTATCEVTVRAIPVTNVTLNHTNFSLIVGGTPRLTATVLPDSATTRTVIWTSSDTNVAKVVNGTITAVASGNATITVTTLDGNKTATCDVTIENIGEISFASDTVWTVGNQIWSDAVQTATCSNKTTFFGGNPSNSPWNFTADCRSNPNQKGDLFSWNFIELYRNTLCPSPWRPPTFDDFKALHFALGGPDTDFNGSLNNVELRDKYLSLWGGSYGGKCTPNGTLETQGTTGWYWALSTTRDGNWGDKLYFNNSDWGFVYSGGIDPKSHGHSLRCVRDK